MKKKDKTAVLAAADVIAIAVIWLLPDPENMLLKRLLIAVLVILAIVLFGLLSKKREVEKGVRIEKIEPVSKINPAQYLSKGGPVCAGADGRYQVTFLLKSGSNVVLSLSAKQAGMLTVSMRGTLIYRDAVFLSFEPEK